MNYVLMATLRIPDKRIYVHNHVATTVMEILQLKVV
jgi:hypothetical protein